MSPQHSHTRQEDKILFFLLFLFCSTNVDGRALKGDWALVAILWLAIKTLVERAGGSCAFPETSETAHTPLSIALGGINLVREESSISIRSFAYLLCATHILVLSIG